MAKRFTRNIRSIEDITKQPKNTNEQNDLLSDEKHVYVRNKDQYEQITGGVKEVNGETPDSNGSVEIDTGAMTVNDKKPDKNGNVNLQIKDFKEQEKLIRKNQLDEALEGIESGYKNYTDNAIEDIDINGKVGGRNYFSIRDWEKRRDFRITGVSAMKIQVEKNQKYTLSSNIEPRSDDAANIFLTYGDRKKLSSSIDGVYPDQPKTITTKDDGMIIVAIRDIHITEPDLWIMLNKGSTAYDWVPNANDLVTKQELDKKLDVELSGYATEDYVNQAINEEAPDLSGYAKKEEVEKYVNLRSGYLQPSDGFKNYDGDNLPTSLQYMISGNLMVVSGVLENTKYIEKDEIVEIVKVPDNFKIIMQTSSPNWGSQRNIFLTQARHYNEHNFDNKITISRFRANNGDKKDLKEGQWLNLNITFGIEIGGF